MHTVTDADLTVAIRHCMEAQPSTAMLTADARLLCDMLGRMIATSAGAIDDVTDTELGAMQRWLPAVASGADGA